MANARRPARPAPSKKTPPAKAKSAPARASRPARPASGHHKVRTGHPDKGHAAPKKGAQPAKAARSARPGSPDRHADLRVSAVRSPHIDALTVYERGVQALQAQQYRVASDLLQSVIDGFPDEKELHERARLYLNVIARRVVPPDATPTTFDERVYAATLAVNSGRHDEGLRLLQALAAEAPSNDYLFYMLAVVQTARGDISSALHSIERAVALNGENRYTALQDSDLEALRDDPAFNETVDRAAAQAVRARLARGRASR